jgi:Mannosyltransferase OCH1 and related enzymes
MFRTVFLFCLCFFNLVRGGPIPYPDFKQSVFLNGIDGRLARYERTYENLNLKYVEMFENIYRRSIAEAEAEPFNPKGRIPKIVHQIWLGGKVPEIYLNWMSSWANLHGWTYKLWMDEDVKTLSMHNRDLYDKTKNVGEKSDILRLEILLKYGGVYVDTDLACMRPEFFEELHQKFDFYIAVEPLFHGIVQEYKIFKFCNAIIASIPQHTLVKDLIINLKANYLAYANQSIFQRTGPNYLTRIISQYELRGAHKQRNMYLPCSFFYPFTICETKNYINCPEKIMDLFPETAGIHYWAGSWRSPTQPSQYGNKHESMD